MLLKPFPFYRFHIERLVRTQPRAFFALAGAVLAFAAASVYCIEQWHLADAAQQELQAMRQKARAPADTANRTANAQVALPAFDSAQLVKTLNRVAAETKLPLDEILFSLDDSANQPYLRYRATLTVSAGYPAIRRFLDRVRADLAEVSLDTISCTREDIATVDLTCDLALSAFFRKDGRG